MQFAPFRELSNQENSTQCLLSTANSCLHSRAALWTRRESNPRPNREPLRFLHAYPTIDFHSAAGHWQPTSNLYCVFQLQATVIAICDLPLDEASLPVTRSGVTRRDLHVPTYRPGLSIITYCNQAASAYELLSFLTCDLIFESHTTKCSACLLNRSSRCQNQGRAHIIFPRDKQSQSSFQPVNERFFATNAAREYTINFVEGDELTEEFVD